MARPREFDESTVLDAAMRCFWANGYGATSVRDLAEQMGITGASLYNAFGDKRSLYRRTLDHYLQQSVYERVGRLESGFLPYPAICAFFDEVVERSVNDQQHRGCMLVNSALEMAPHDAGFQKIVADELIYIEDFFRRCVMAGQRDGTVTSVRPADELAKLLLSVLLGIRVLARARPHREVLEGPAKAVLGLLKMNA
jgi:TetR/AcrR family transcriptional regulator, transcriptional repressor for nem operon